MLVAIADVSTQGTTAAERLWTARVVHTALDEGLSKIDMAVATYGRREPLSLFCSGEPGTGKPTLAELFIERYRGAHLPGRILYVLLPCPASPSNILEELLEKLGALPQPRDGGQPHAPLSGAVRSRAHRPVDPRRARQLHRQRIGPHLAGRGVVVMDD